MSRIVQQLYSLCKCLNSIWKVETTLETSIQKQLSHFKISIYSRKFCSTAQKIQYCMNVQKAWKLHLKFSFLSFSVKFICLWLITEQPAINVLKEVQLYLQKNPNEMVTIMIEDHVISPTGVRCLMLLAWGNSGSQFLKYQKKVEIGQQLILWSRKISAYLFSLFTSNSTKEASEGISYQWNYIVENQCKPNFLLLLWNFRGPRIHFY